jgi:TonB family protein
VRGIATVVWMVVAMMASLGSAVDAVAIGQGGVVKAEKGVSGPVPVGDPASWVTPDDYPADALHANLNGVVDFAAQVDPQGHVTACNVTASSKVPSLDLVTCDLIKAHASFTPARNNKGQPVAGVWKSRVKWLIPQSNSFQNVVNMGGYGQPLDAPAVMVQSYIVEADGTHSDCRNERAEGKSNQGIPVGPVPCYGARSVSGYVDAQGKPQRRRVTLTISTTVEPVR